MNRRASVALALLCGLAFSGSGIAAPHAVSVDDLMKLRWIADVQISPDGSRVAYVVSQPNVETNTHHKLRSSMNSALNSGILRRRLAICCATAK